MVHYPNACLSVQETAHPRKAHISKLFLFKSFVLQEKMSKVWLWKKEDPQASDLQIKRKAKRSKKIKKEKRKIKKKKLISLGMKY